MQRAVISREPYLLSMVFSRFILIGKLYKTVIKVCHPYREVLSVSFGWA